jgi:hypothetical protein
LTTQYKKSRNISYIRRFVTRITQLGRMARLRRQFTEIQRRTLDLPRSQRAPLAELIRRECDQIGDNNPKRYGSTPEDERASGGLDIGYERAHSDNLQVRMRGLALWLALVYQETRAAESDEGEALYRRVLHLMRELNVFASAAADGDNA